MKSSVVKRTTAIDGHKTSISLEDAFWTALKEIAHGRRESLGHLITSIDANRRRRRFANLSSAIRLSVLEFYKERFAQQHGIEHGEIQQAKRRKRRRPG